LEKDAFLFLAENYTSLNQEETHALILLLDDFPYSQIIHVLAARAAQDNLLDSREHLLHTSAIYTTDRAILKSIMTAPRSERAVANIARTGKAGVTGVLVEETLPDVANLPHEINLSGEALLNDIFLELEKLKVSKHNFEVSLDAYEKHISSSPPIPKKGGKTSRKPPEHPDQLIQEIKTTKKKVNPEGKQKEQIEIIENFIKVKPSITKNKGNLPVDNSDLAEKSLMFGDNIVSETLVEILLKQGKKDKAIEVLKKLIWKFPQKKAYFAAQIEDLKK
jgi:tetratricopeptide (TPR) repeat protein